MSFVEVENHSVAYFHHITVFKKPHHWTYVKGGAHTYFIDLLIFTHLQSAYDHGMNPAQKFSGMVLKHSDAIEICDGIISTQDCHICMMNCTCQKASGWVHRIHELIKHGHTRSEVINSAHSVSLALSPACSCLQFLIVAICKNGGGRPGIFSHMHDIR